MLSPAEEKQYVLCSRVFSRNHLDVCEVEEVKPYVAHGGRLDHETRLLVARLKARFVVAGAAAQIYVFVQVTARSAITLCCRTFLFFFSLCSSSSSSRCRRPKCLIYARVTYNALCRNSRCRLQTNERARRMGFLALLVFYRASPRLSCLLRMVQAVGATSNVMALLLVNMIGYAVGIKGVGHVADGIFIDRHGLVAAICGFAFLFSGVQARFCFLRPTAFCVVQFARFFFCCM